MGTPSTTPSPKLLPLQHVARPPTFKNPTSQFKRLPMLRCKNPGSITAPPTALIYEPLAAPVGEAPASHAAATPVGEAPASHAASVGDAPEAPVGEAQAYAPASHASPVGDAPEAPVGEAQAYATSYMRTFYAFNTIQANLLRIPVTLERIYHHNGELGLLVLAIIFSFYAPDEETHGDHCEDNWKLEALVQGIISMYREAWGDIFTEGGEDALKAIALKAMELNSKHVKMHRI